jgi:hypothetical protein
MEIKTSFEGRGRWRTQRSDIGEIKQARTQRHGPTTTRSRSARTTAVLGVEGATSILRTAAASVRETA